MDSLELDIIKEMVLQSPHQKVQSLAAQALGGLLEKYPVNDFLSDALYTQVWHHWKETNYCDSPTGAERLTRAMAYCALHYRGTFSPWIELHRSDFDTGHLDDPKLAAIRALVHVNTIMDDTNWMALDELTHRFLYLPPSDEMFMLHPWIIHQLTNAAILSTNWQTHSQEYWNFLFEQFLRDLSFDREFPSL